jgi:hypothetical protein
MHRAYFKTHQSADRSAEMNEYTRETENPANERKNLTLASRLIEAAEVKLYRLYRLENSNHTTA